MPLIAGKIDGQVVTVVSSKEGAYAMERAAKHNIPSVVISKKDYPNAGFEKALYDHFNVNECGFNYIGRIYDNIR